MSSLQTHEENVPNYFILILHIGNLPYIDMLPIFIILLRSEIWLRITDV